MSAANRIDQSERGTQNVRVTRPKLFKTGVNLNLLLSREMLDQIDAAREDYQSRVDFIRRAIARELERVDRVRRKRAP